MEGMLNLPEYVKLNYSPVKIDARIDEVVPRVPVSSTEVIEGVTFAMEQDTYPLKTAYITVILKNQTNAVYEYTIKRYGIEKYISGSWQKLELPIWGMEESLKVLEHCQAIDTFNPIKYYGYLGAGLYRIPVYAFEDDYHKRSEGYVEFVISPEAEQLPYTIEEKKSIDEKTKPDWLWYTNDELLEKLKGSMDIDLISIRSWSGKESVAVMQCVAPGTDNRNTSAPSWIAILLFLLRYKTQR